MLNLQSIYFGLRHSGFTCSDYDIIKKVQRLYRKHKRQAENSCNGVGYVKGQVYYNGHIDDYVRREYGYNVKSAYLTKKDLEDGVSIFDNEMDRISDKIDSLIKDKPRFKVEYQGDPRGYTVKLFYDGEMIVW